MNLNAQIEARSRAFVDDITSILRESVLQALSRGELGFRLPAVTAPRMRAAKATRSNQLAKGEKRSPMLIAQLTEALAKTIEIVPGKRIEELSVDMEVSTQDLRLPVKRLLDADRIFTKGEKRATRYYPVSAKAVG
jgi:hypothetical protein